MTAAELLVAKTTTTVNVSVSVRGVVEDSLNLTPIHTSSLTPVDAPTLHGIPRKPLMWIRGQQLLSASGQRLNISDPNPEAITTTADTRFLASEEFWDSEQMLWTPVQSTLSYWAMRATSLPTSPVLDTYDILTKEGVLQREGFDLSGGAFLVTDFSRDRVLSQTISMVIQPMAPDTPIMDFLNIEDLNNLPEPLQRTGIWRTDKYDFYWSGTGASVDPVVPMSKHCPIYLTMVIDPPQVRLYVSLSGKHNFFQTKASVSPNITTPLSLGFGKSALDATPGNYRLFEVNFWDDALSSDQVMSHHSLMMSTYGVHYEWG